jgi:hypothetical protein
MSTIWLIMWSFNVTYESPIKFDIIMNRILLNSSVYFILFQIIVKEILYSNMLIWLVLCDYPPSTYELCYFISQTLSLHNETIQYNVFFSLIRVWNITITILNKQPSKLSKILWVATDRWFSPGTPVSSTNKTDRHDITEILLKVVLNTINPNPTNVHKIDI